MLSAIIHPDFQPPINDTSADILPANVRPSSAPIFQASDWDLSSHLTPKKLLSKLSRLRPLTKEQLEYSSHLSPTDHTDHGSNSIYHDSDEFLDSKNELSKLLDDQLIDNSEEIYLKLLQVLNQSKQSIQSLTKHHSDLSSQTLRRAVIEIKNIQMERNEWKEDVLIKNSQITLNLNQLRSLKIDLSRLIASSEISGPVNSQQLHAAQSELDEKVHAVLTQQTEQLHKIWLTKMGLYDQFMQELEFLKRRTSLILLLISTFLAIELYFFK